MKLSDITWSINFVALWRFVKKHILKINSPIKNFGLLPDKWDERDIYYKRIRPAVSLPASTNRCNISQFPYCYDQGDIGSCVGNGIVEAFRRTLHVNTQKDFDLSRLFAYWISRDDKINDTGCSIREAFKAVNKYGICSEQMWPYITKRFAENPPVEAFVEALDHQSISYQRIYPVTKESIMDAIYRGFPVVYGKQLYDSFMSEQVARTGVVPNPRTCKEKLMGGHCMVIFDYDEDGTIELNSWGKDWGIEGTCHVPWDYVLSAKLSSDFWVFYKTE